MKRFLCLILITCLSGCYTPQQAAFDAKVNKQIVPGMPVSEAVARLELLHFQCSEKEDFIDCTQIKEGSLPSCVERVKLFSDGNIASSIAISHFMCLDE